MSEIYLDRQEQTCKNHLDSERHLKTEVEKQKVSYFIIERTSQTFPSVFEAHLFRSDFISSDEDANLF